MVIPKVADYKRPSKHQKKKVKNNDKEEEDTSMGDEGGYIADFLADPDFLNPTPGAPSSSQHA